jgi:hypothetical protein
MDAARLLEATGEGITGTRSKTGDVRDEVMPMSMFAKYPAE